MIKFSSGLGRRKKRQVVNTDSALEDKHKYDKMVAVMYTAIFNSDKSLTDGYGHMMDGMLIDCIYQVSETFNSVEFDVIAY